MYYRLPLFSVNVKGWLYFGYIGKRNQGIKSLLIVNALLTLAAEILLYIKTEDVSNVIRDIFKTAILFNSLVRILYVMRREEDFIQFMKGIESWYQEFKVTSPRVLLVTLIVILNQFSSFPLKILLRHVYILSIILLIILIYVHISFW